MDGQFYIDGEWILAPSDQRLVVVNPATLGPVGHVAMADAVDVDRAVAAARAALPAWSSVSADRRIELVASAIELLSRHADALADLLSQEVGTPITEARTKQVARALMIGERLCASATKVAWSEVGDGMEIWREPSGVVAAITSWSRPLEQMIIKVASPLLAGCTVVLKPSELGSLSAYPLMDSLAEAGVPRGVVNLVTGRGAVGESLVVHPGVDAVTFTGTTEVGRHVAELAAAGMKRLVLGLGGKSPSILLDDADVQAAVQATVASCFSNSGQACGSLSRLVVPRVRKAEVERAVMDAVGALRVGPPDAETTTIGPVISSAQRVAVLEHVESGIREGARLLAGGPDARVPVGGHYVAPTVLTDVAPHMEVAEYEVFGPLLCIMAYDTEADAVKIANDSPYGLAAAIWSADPGRARSVARMIRTGQVTLNSSKLPLDAPFGGFGDSGLGRERGVDGILSFTELKTVGSVPAHCPTKA